VLVLATIFVPVAASGQRAAGDVSAFPSASGALGTGVPTQALIGSAAARGITAEGLVLEGAIDAAAYLVGPGDVFTVAIGGSIPRQSSAMVSADGTLVVPEAGSFRVAGLSLARVQSLVGAALQRRYANVVTDVALLRPRRFFVHVSGGVADPGRREVSAVARVEEAVAGAARRSVRDLADYDAPDFSEQEPRRPALRNVRIDGVGGRTSVDLMRYLATGDLGSNPYLADGDRIHVPSFNPLVDGVVVGGAVDRPGTYDVRPGDTARDLIEVTSGLGASSRIARVRVVRAGAAPTEVSLAEAGAVSVLARDHVYAIPAQPDAATALVSGAVRYPGVYPIIRGQTTLAELIEMAGGLRDDALARATYLERPPRPIGAAQQRATSEAQEATLPDVSVDAGLLEGLFGRQFYARQTFATPRVSLDPEAAIAGAQSVSLLPGDRLVVPFDDGLVRVYGRVVRSGFVPFAPGLTAEDYIARAGGMTSAASGVYVIDAATGQLSQGAGTPVRPGDAVFVNSLPSPDSPEFAELALQERRDQREDARDRRTARNQFIQTTLGIAGTVASLIIAYVTLQSVNSN
jgi:protein involved in polysaccharide export with SLBB domain